MRECAPCRRRCGCGMMRVLHPGKEGAMKPKSAVLAAVVVLAGVGAVPAGAHEGHTSCKEAGQLAAFLAKVEHPLGEEVSAVARVGGVNEFIAGVHATVCEP
jgi:hypothetical protein